MKLLLLLEEEREGGEYRRLKVALPVALRLVLPPLLLRETRVRGAVLRNVELLLRVVVELLPIDERRPAPEAMADSLRVDPVRPLLNEVAEEGLPDAPELRNEE